MSIIGMLMVKILYGTYTYIILLLFYLFFRLIITLPHDKHDLSATRYYMALLAISSLPAQATHLVPVPTYGTVFFRQDQLHIDLFVFFSVFFSCFFLFLAVCVVGWKAKQVNNTTSLLNV